MVFKSPVQDVSLTSDIGSLIDEVKFSQLNFSKAKINEFNSVQDDIFDEIMPEDSPEVLLEKRRRLKALKKCRIENSDIG